jgi:hypothetical protein
MYLTKFIDSRIFPWAKRLSGFDYDVCSIHSHAGSSGLETTANILENIYATKGANAVTVTKVHAQI